jgi:hypothetical protein
MPFAQTPTGIPIEAAMNIYFIGDVLYHGPDETIHTLSFCYESLPGGSFKPLFGAPYNERRTAQE